MRIGAFLALAALVNARAATQTQGQPEEFHAIAIVSNNVMSGAGRVDIRITRWSTENERMRLVNTLRAKGADALLDELRETTSVGFIRTPDSLGYDLHYAHQIPGEDGGRRVVLATDRPMGFWETWNQPRTISYPFTVIQMQIGRDGKGKGTMSYATKIAARGNVIELEDFATSPIMLTEIEARKPTH
jgi:hypothetical protein